MITVLRVLLWIVEGGLAAIVGYLAFLTCAAHLAPRRTLPRQGSPDHRFLLLIPAHNEEQLLPGLIANLRQLAYPASLYAIHVVADNCVDRTAELARRAGATVHERTDTELIGKGYALHWLIQRIWQRAEPHDAVVILDADSIISENFLTVMDARLARGEQVIQGYYAVRDPDRSWSASLRAVALAALHYLRPQGRTALGCSVGLKGNGMVFTTGITQHYHWPASLTEDIEYHMALILGGERVTFAPDAIVWAEMPGTLAAAQTQNMRWERGRLQMLRHYAPQLIRAAVVKRRFLLLDAAIEQLIPPFSLLAAASVCCLLAALALRTPAGIVLGALLIFGQIIYILDGLMLARVPRKVYQALLFAPLFVAWKIWLYARVLLGLDRNGWTRTARNEVPRNDQGLER